MKLLKANHWDTRFFQLCELIASWSEDRSRKVGAVIVGSGNEIRSTGYNGFPRRIDASIDERHQHSGGEKYLWVEHAERNAIYNAARNGTSLLGCRMYCSLFPCADCVRAVIQSGIVQLNTFLPPEDDKIFKRSFEVSNIMLSEAEVEIRFFKK